MKTSLLASVLILGTSLLACDSTEVASPARRTKSAAAARPAESTLPVVSYGHAAAPFANSATTHAANVSPDHRATPGNPPAKPNPAPTRTPSRPAHLFM